MTDRPDEDLDDGLWDPSRPKAPHVARLEELLSPLGRKPDGPVAQIPLRPVRSLPLGWSAAAAAALAAAALLPVFLRDRPREEVASQPKDPVITDPPATPGPSLHVDGTGDRLAAGSWVEAAEEPRDLVLGDIGRIRLDAGSRVQVRRLADDATRLYLARGRLEASVSADARPRFFQVDTDAARCVDLGCRYTLSVDDAGIAHVTVTLGQVAFETEGTGGAAGREVYVPAGAECRARPDRGPGTPRFSDAPAEIAAAFDAYDDAPRNDAAARKRAALAAIEAVRTGRDTLPVWHLLQDPDPEVAGAAAARLDLVTHGCRVAEMPKLALTDAQRAEWKEYLARACW